LNRVRDERHKFRDHDYIETEDGWLFGVVSDTHPPDRVLAYLKYMPGAGLWSRSDISYRRVLTTYSLPEVAKVLELVKAIKPGYVFNDPMTGEEFTYVPVADVRRHYMCEERLERLLQGPRNGVERGCAMLVERLADASGVGTGFYGVSGSILTGLHNPAADIDLTVYGRQNFWKTVEASENIQTPESIQQTRKLLAKNYVTKYPITHEDAERLAERCVTRGIYRGYFYSLHAVRLLDEIRESYGDRLYRGTGVVRAELHVVDASEGIYTPAVYRVEGRTSEGQEVETLTCYDTTFAALLREGDTVEALGKLEKVQDLRINRTYYSLLIGSIKAAGREYIKLK
jgi:predicted nucleotidyltransferase